MPPTDPTVSREDRGQPESLRTVVVALVANALVAVSKSFAAAITGSASMLAEAAHSWADTGNEILLYVAGRRSVQPPDMRHPLGFGREAYVWALFAAFGLFAVGAVVSISHGIQELLDPEPATNFLVSYSVLAVAFVLEGISFLQAAAQARTQAESRHVDVLEHVLQTSDPTLRAVYFEDASALVGLVIAFVGILLHEVTGSAIPDALGSILVGCLLAFVAIMLIQKNRRFLVGVAVDPRVRAAALQTLVSHPEVRSVSYLHIEYVGPARVFLVAALDLEGNADEDTVAARLGTLADEIEDRPPVVRAILTLSRPGAPALTPQAEAPGSRADG